MTAFANAWARLQKDYGKLNSKENKTFFVCPYMTTAATALHACMHTSECTQHSGLVTRVLWENYIHNLQKNFKHVFLKYGKLANLKLRSAIRWAKSHSPCFG